MAEEFKLPTTKIAATTKDPKSLIIFAKPKVGKTSLLAGLENCLIIDLENGTDYVEALKLKAHSISDIRKIIDAVIAASKPYDYIAVDTITRLEDMCIPYAEQLYANSPQGKTWFPENKKKYGNLLHLPNGAGYPWLREAFTKVIDLIKCGADKIILVKTPC
jgi:hypothetical protein